MEALEWSSPRAVEIWGVNYPGFGGSTGPASLAAIGPAALTAFDALKKTAAGRPILVFGTSIGTTAALHVAAQPAGRRGVVLQNPPPLRQIVLRQYGWWNLWLIAGPVGVAHPLRARQRGQCPRRPRAGRVPARGEGRIVAPRFQRLVVDAYAGKKRIIPLPGAGHKSPIEGAVREEFSARWIGCWQIRPRRPRACSPGRAGCRPLNPAIRARLPARLLLK